MRTNWDKYPLCNGNFGYEFLSKMCQGILTISDLMLDELISKEDLKKQTEFYNSEIARLTEEIAASQDVSSAHQKQIDGIRNYIKQVNQTAEMDTDSTKIYGELLKKVVVHEEGITDFYLTCVPFGFRMIYHLHRYNRGHQLDVFVDNCEVIY